MQLIATEHVIPYTKSWSASIISVILKAAYDDVIIIILFHMGKYGRAWTSFQVLTR